MPSCSEGIAHPNLLSTAPAARSKTCANPSLTEPISSPTTGDLIAARIEAAALINQANGQRGRSWALPGREPVLVWQSRTQWLAAVAAHLACTKGLRLCRRRHLSPKTALLVARACAHFADSRTGRGVTASNRTIAQLAARLGGRAKDFCPDVVTATRAVLAELELAVEVAQGRYLTESERLQAAVHHDGVQLRAASTWALTTPRRWYAKSDLPRRGSTGSETPRRNNSPKCAQARTAPSGRTPRRKSPERPLAAQRLTGQLLQKAPSLDDGRHIGRIVDVVHELVDCARWTAQDLIAVLNEDARTHPRDWPSRITNPAGFLRHRLSLLSDRLAGRSPSEVARAQREAVLKEQRRRQEEDLKATRSRASSSHVAKVMAEFRATRNARSRRNDTSTIPTTL